MCAFVPLLLNCPFLDDEVYDKRRREKDLGIRQVGWLNEFCDSF